MRARRVLVVVLAAVSGSAVLPAQAPARNASGGPLAPDQACYDVLRYRLRIAVDPAQKRIDGVLTMRARRVAAGERIALDLDPALAIGGVRVDGQEAAIVRDGGRFTAPVAAPVGADAKEIVFTSGATASNILAIKGVAHF